MSASLSLTMRRPIYGRGQSVAYTGTAGTIANALPSGTNSVMVWCTTQAYVRVGNGSGIAATTSDVPLPAGFPINLPVEVPTSPGTNPAMYVSAIRDSASGTLYVMPLAD